jgi:hypothetical protein
MTSGPTIHLLRKLIRTQLFDRPFVCFIVCSGVMVLLACAKMASLARDHTCTITVTAAGQKAIKIVSRFQSQ